MAHDAQAQGQPVALRTNSLDALRRQVARLEGGVPSCRARSPAVGGSSTKTETGIALGIDAFDVALGGGCPMAAMTEIRSAETRDWGMANAFAFALICMMRMGQPQAAGPLVWISAPDALAEGGEPFLPGLTGFSPRPPQLLIVRPRKTEEALWAAEAAAGAQGIAATVLEIRGNPSCLGFTESRRLHLRARQTGRPLLLLRQAGIAEASAVPVRFRVGPAPGGLRALPDGSGLTGSLGNPAFAVTLEKSRLASPLTLILEWNPDDCRLILRSHPAGHDAGVTDAADPGDLLSVSAHRPDRTGASGRVLAFARAS